MSQQHFQPDSEIVAKLVALGRIGGWAAGNYMCTCVTCQSAFDGDKRAFSCLPCAVAGLKKRAEAVTADRLAQALARSQFKKALANWSGALTEEQIATIDRMAVKDWSEHLPEARALLEEIYAS